MHENINRDVAEQRLRENGQPGAYLVRAVSSIARKGPYAGCLVVWSIQPTSRCAPPPGPLLRHVSCLARRDPTCMHVYRCNVPHTPSLDRGMLLGLWLCVLATRQLRSKGPDRKSFAYSCIGNEGKFIHSKVLPSHTT